MTAWDYFQAYEKYFWNWEEDAEVVSITGGSTIGFKAQVVELLTDIAENGLPPFGAFLLAMIATNKTMDNGVESVGTIIDRLEQEGLVTYSAQIKKQAFSFLEVLQDIPPDYVVGKRRQILLRTIFSNSHNRINVPTSKGIVKTLQSNSLVKTKLLKLKDFSAFVFTKDFRTIELLLRTFPTADAIVKQMGELPDLDENDIPTLENADAGNSSYKDFVEELLDNPKTFQTAALIKPIWAAFKIPFFNAHPSEQPLGGVSDLSNKGDFDKLLISEFANDDLVFMNRIANNEALYIRREMPPVKDQLHRSILIDISLKTWGTPKILAHAAYIAIARHPKSLTETNAFVIGNQYNAVSCDNIGEVIDGLQKVEAALHAAKGLTAFLEANKNDTLLELIYITTADAMRYPEIQKLLNDHHSLFKYIITTDATGEIDFYSRRKHVQKHLQTVRLPLNTLWSKRNFKQPETGNTEMLPVKEEIVPILLPTPMNISNTIPLGEEVYIVANKCLYKRTAEQNSKSKKAWQLILRHIPANAICELGMLENGETLFLAFNPQNKELCITNLDTLKKAKTVFERWSGKRYPRFLFNKYHQFIYLVGNPDSYTFYPDFEKGDISFREQRLTSNNFESFYPNRQKEIDEFPKIYGGNIFKNIKEVYISQNNYLTFNGHELIPIEQSIQFSSSNRTHSVVKAVKANKTATFKFPDNSKVIIDPAGFIRLVSGGYDFLNVYIIPIMDMSMGVATSLEFAGNDFYYDNNMWVNLRIESVTNKLDAIKVLKSNYDTIGLAEAKSIVDSVPRTITTKITYTIALKTIGELKRVGCIASVSKPKYEAQTIISPREFYLKNIATFIGRIINYAPAD